VGRRGGGSEEGRRSFGGRRVRERREEGRRWEEGWEREGM